MKFKDTVKFREERRTDLAWYKSWKDERGITGKENGPELVGKILARMPQSLMIQAYERLVKFAETDAEAKGVLEDDELRRSWIEVMAANIREELV